MVQPIPFSLSQILLQIGGGLMNIFEYLFFFFFKLKYDSCLFSFLFIWWNQKGPKEVINVHCVRALGNASRVECMNSIVHHM